ncbi:MAG: oxygenase MpaB family protein [Methylovulum sp.]|nr:oxygenase MpaB family protein [Methylovulum sp.]
MIERLNEDDIPTDYRAGFAQAKLIDPPLAENYIRHTLIGDPDADLLIEFLATLPPAERQQWISKGIETGPSGLADAPYQVREFFEKIEEVPAWFDPKKVNKGCAGFHRHSTMFVGAFVAGVLVEGFATLISKSFCITGRVVDQGVRRLKQNNRHLMEIMLPGGLERHGDGWKLSVRLRLVHAQIRVMLKHSEDWDSAAWGVPISAAHIGLATAVFSALLLKRAELLGVKLSDEERESFMMIWRYTGHLMGVPESIHFDSEHSALHLHRVGVMCEPAPSFESIIMANALINSAPIVAGITEPQARRKLANHIYKISRALIGPEMADQFNFPKYNTFGVLAFFRFKNGMESLLQRFFPSLERSSRAGQFIELLNVSLYTDEGIRYRMPDRLYAEEDGEL